LTLKQYKLKNGVSLASLSAFSEADADELRVLCLLASAPHPLSADELAVLLGTEVGAVKDALSFWRGGGAVTGATRKAEASSDTTTEAPKKVTEEKPTKTAAPSEAVKARVDATKSRPVQKEDRLPDYSPAEAAEIVEEENLARFVAACEGVYGKSFSPRDTATVLGLYRELSLSTDYILLLLAYCQGDESGRGKKPMRYVEKVAFTLFDEGIRTAEALTAYIDEKTRFRDEERELRRILGMGERPLTTKEETLFPRWLSEYGFSLSVIKHAYDLCAAARNKYDVAYMEGILSKWNKAGCKNLADVNALQEKEKANRPVPTKNGKRGLSAAAEKEKDEMRTLEVEDFFAKAIERSYSTEDPK
jgi:DnaD/phage-associated family protein